MASVLFGERLKVRLGLQFEIQAAQLLALGRVEEQAAQSSGAHWCMLVDKMDQRKTVVPGVWSQLAKPLFKEVDRSLVTVLNGTMWFGTTQTTHHLRTVFDVCQHGAEMHSSTFLWNLQRVAKEEGYLTAHWSICADETRKETNNRTLCGFLCGCCAHWSTCHSGGLIYCSYSWGTHTQQVG